MILGLSLSALENRQWHIIFKIVLTKMQELPRVVTRNQHLLKGKQKQNYPITMKLMKGLSLNLPSSYPVVPAWIMAPHA